MKRILVGTDTSPSADLAVRTAAELARRSEAELLVVYVRADSGLHDAADPRKRPDPERYMADLAARFPEVRVRAWVEPGEPADRLCEVAADQRVDTIVVGNKGVHGSRWRVRESVPTMIVRHAPCSVYIVDTRVAQ